jgi:Phenazine biosynthesis-like protein
MRVGALDGRHPKLEGRILQNLKLALKPNCRLLIDGGLALREIALLSAGLLPLETGPVRTPCVGPQCSIDPLSLGDRTSSAGGPVRSFVGLQRSPKRGLSLSRRLVVVCAKQLLGGNPLAVVDDAYELTDLQRHQIAGEFNQAETTFILKSTRAGHNALGARVWLASLGEFGPLDKPQIIHQETRNIIE